MKKCSWRAFESETREQPLCRDGVLKEVDVSIEVEAEVFGAYSSHRHNRREVAFLATSHHGHRGAVTRRFGHTERQVSQRNRLEIDSRVIIDAGLRE